jgi:hypothetical protein
MSKVVYHTGGGTWLISGSKTIFADLIRLINDPSEFSKPFINKAICFLGFLFSGLGLLIC